ncbi:MAG: BACON domain-containing carbohydrate-binding protein [Bacteroidota bacterium]
MKKSIYLILLFFTPIICISQTLFRSGNFLHHSTGGNIWGPNSSSTSIPDQIAIYNTVHGYSGTDSISMNQQWWPSGGNNEWEYWHRIFDNQTPEANILPILQNNKIVVIKSCYPSSEMTGSGQPTDTLNRTIKSVYNYKWHWRNIVRVMAAHPENFFVIWTNAPLVAGNTNPTAAMLSKQFTTWAKDTLAMGLDPEMCAFPRNIYVFHYFSKLTDANGFELSQYAVSSSDSHPNALATALVAPMFVNEIFDAAYIYEQNEATLSVIPSDQNVNSTTITAVFAVTSNTDWTNSSNENWCTVTPSGNGNGNITVTFEANTEEARSAIITVTVDGLPSVDVTLTQDGFTEKSLSLSLLIEGLYAGGGIMNRANDELGPYFGPGIADVVIIELHNAADYGIVGYTSPEVELSVTGTVSVSIPSEFNGNYYITVKHRNSIETTSASPVSFAASLSSYTFNLPAKVYGGNMLLMADGHYVIFSGDVNQDGIVDTADMTPVDNDASNFVSGYLPTDVNCDGTIDTGDITIIDNNADGFVSSLTP